MATMMIIMTMTILIWNCKKDTFEAIVWRFCYGS